MNCVTLMNEAGREYPDGEYRVGRGKPPLHTRFKKGQSGNPRGPRRKSLPALLVAALDEPVVVKKNGESRRITKREAVVAQLVDQSAGADLRATKMLIDMLKDIEKRAGAMPSPEQSPFTAADEEVVENLLARLRRTELAKIHHEDTENTEQNSSPIGRFSDGPENFAATSIRVTLANEACEEITTPLAQHRCVLRDDRFAVSSG